MSVPVAQEPSGFLEGIKVLDLTRLLPGGYCTLLLADMGAEVIKVEDPWQGDYFRWMPPFSGQYGAYFNAVNSGKKSVVINLKADAGIQVFLRLVASADIVVESFRPGVIAKLGIDYERLYSINPRLVYCSLSGYGQTGPYKSRAGHDLNYAGLTGLLPNGNFRVARTEPARDPPQAQAADIGAGYAAAFAIVAALCARARTGEGVYLDISAADVALTFVLLPLVQATCMNGGFPATALAGGELSGALACYNIYRTADDQCMTLAALEPKFWRAFLSAVNRLDLFEKQLDPCHQPELKATLAEMFLQRTQEEWVALFSEEPNACCEPLLNWFDILRHPQFQARDMFFPGTIGSQSVLQVASPCGERPPQRPPAPGFGEHTAELLASCGFTSEEIRKFHRNGVIRLSADE